MVTLHDKYCFALFADGWRKSANARTGKYTELMHPIETYKIYVGLSGALRRGKTVASSMPFSDKYKGMLLNG